MLKLIKWFNSLNQNEQARVIAIILMIFTLIMAKVVTATNFHIAALLGFVGTIYLACVFTAKGLGKSDNADNIRRK